MKALVSLGLGGAIIAAALAVDAPGGEPRSSFWSGWSLDRCGDCRASAQSRLTSSGPRLSTGAIF